MSAIYTPDTEPYLGLNSVLVFDNMISAALSANTAIAKLTEKAKLSSLQLAATQLVPHGLSISLSIRELVRQGYLLSGEILLRPLMERVAVLSYLASTESAVALWEGGWPYKSRPTLAQMLNAMTGNDPTLAGAAKRIVDEHNALVHADPNGALRHLGWSDGNPTFSVSKTLDDPKRCDRLCLDASTWLSILTLRMCEVFPDAA